jgi:chromosome partitioning protein
MGKIWSVINQKGGVGKSSVVRCLGEALSRRGKRVILVDADAQANLTVSISPETQNPDELPHTIASALSTLASGGKPNPSEFIMRSEGFDFVPSSIELAEVELRLMNVISRELILKKFVDSFKDNYDYVFIDTQPSLGVLVVGALTAADNVIICSQPQYFSLKGMELLCNTISQVKEGLNPNLQIAGVVINMFDGRLNFHKEVVDALEQNYGNWFNVFKTRIPTSIRLTESQAQGKSIIDFDKNGKIAKAFDELAREVVSHG